MMKIDAIRVNRSHGKATKLDRLKRRQGRPISAEAYRFSGRRVMLHAKRGLVRFNPLRVKIMFIASDNIQWRRRRAPTIAILRLRLRVRPPKGIAARMQSGGA